MSDRLFLDTETFSPIKITNGSYKYSEGAEVMIVTYAFNKEPVQLWDRTLNPETTAPPMPVDLREALADPEIEIVGHNIGGFDRVVIEKDLRIIIPSERTHDTFARAYAHNLPGSLDTLCSIFNVPVTKAKDKAGKKLIQLFCKPRLDGTRATQYTHPDEWAHFCAYAKLDIEAMRYIDAHMPNWNYVGFEKNLWNLDQKINKRGFAIDTDLIDAVIQAVDEAQVGHRKRVVELTAGEVSSATRRDLLLKHVLETYDVALPDMQAATIERRIEDPKLPEGLRELLKIRLMACTSSTAKYQKIRASVSADRRLRGTIQWCGAGHTGRDAGRILNPQNLPRPTMEPEDIDFGIRAFKAGCADLFFENVMGLASNTLRGVIIAAPKKKIIVADLKNIEGRYAAWLAGEEWKLQAFREYDAGTGADLYALAYARMFRVSPESVMEDKKNGGNQRQVGKTLELACFARNTLVLTHTGTKHIVEVLSTDLLWDGVEWVSHQGLIAKGARRVVCVAGIELTAEHLVLTGRTWSRAEQLVSKPNMLYLALATASANLPSRVTVMGMRAAYLIFWCSALVGVRGITRRHRISEAARVRVAENAQKKKLVSGVSTIMATLILLLMKNIVDVCWDVYALVLPVVTYLPTEDILTTEVGASLSFRRGETIKKNFYSILLLLRDGIILLSRWIEKKWIGVTNLAMFALLPEHTIGRIRGVFKKCKNESWNSKLVYDIAHAGPRNRFTVVSSRGPLIVHNCGFQGGVGSFVTFATALNVDLQEIADKNRNTIPADIREEAMGFWGWAVKEKRTLGLERDVFVACDALKRLWRNAHPNFVWLWAQLETQVREAIETKGTTFKIGKRLAVRRDGNWLRILMPSGRSLSYPAPRVDDKGQISFMGMDQYSRQWKRIKTYGGKLFNNPVQGGARDVFMHGLVNAERAGYETVLRVHDELVTEVPDTDRYTLDGLCTAMTTDIDWVDDLPLSAGGYEAYRYRKDE